MRLVIEIGLKTRINQCSTKGGEKEESASTAPKGDGKKN